MSTNYHTKYEQNRIEECPEIEQFFYDIDRETASRAYNNTSHFPERAGSLVRSDYAKDLITDKSEIISDIRRAIQRGATVDESWEATVESWFIGHRSGLKSKYIAYLHSRSSVASSFICGLAKFPTARNQKRSQWADNHYDNIGKFRHTSKKRILREILPHGDGSAIRSDDPDANSKIEHKIISLENQRDTMKAINKAVRKFYKVGDNPQPNDGKYSDCIKSIVSLGMSEANAAELIKPNYMGRCIPFESYSLSNIGAEIRRLKQRTREVEKVKQVAIDDKFPNGETVTISDDGKIVIDFGYKPTEEVRAALKKNAFKWSRARMAWVRKLTANAEAAYSSYIKPMLEGGA